MNDVCMLLKHWEGSPPLHVSVAGLLGTGKKGERGGRSSAANVQAFVDEFKRGHAIR